MFATRFYSAARDLGDIFACAAQCDFEFRMSDRGSSIRNPGIRWVSEIHNHGGTGPDPPLPSEMALIDEQLQMARTANDGAATTPPPVQNCPQAMGLSGRKRLQILARNIRDAVAEVVDPDDLSHETSGGIPTGPRDGQADWIPNLGAEPLGRNAPREVTGHGREHVPTVKGGTLLSQQIFPGGDHPNSPDRSGGHRITQQAVVRGHEELVVNLRQDRPPRTTDSRVHDPHVDRPGWKEAHGRQEEEAPTQDVVGGRLMAEVHHGRGGAQAQDHALHDPDERVLVTEIGEQRGDGMPGAMRPAWRTLVF